MEGVIEAPVEAQVMMILLLDMGVSDILLLTQANDGILANGASASNELAANRLSFSHAKRPLPGPRHTIPL